MVRVLKCCVWIVGCWAIVGQAIQTDPRSESQFYMDSFGVVDYSDFALSGRVQTVFEKLLRVADKADYKDPGLLLIDSPNWPWAIALPDNNIILSKGAVVLCYRGVSRELGDARLAMILGHELGHLAEDDYWHRDVYLSLGNRDELEADNVLRFIGERSGLVNPDSKEWQNLVRDRELRADDRGFIYASLAGFDTNLLLNNESSSFFHYWTEQTSVNPDKYHLTPGERASYLNARSSALSEIAELFEFGVAMTHLGEYGAAEKVFRQVLTQFPAHEVYNNLGYIQLQKGLKRVSVDADKVFWFPSTLDSSPQTTEIMKRNIGTNYLGDAADFFELSIKQNPGYLNGYLNLATAFYYQDKFNSAAATLAEARSIVGEDPEIEGLWQIAMLRSLQGTVDYHPIALAKLSTLARMPSPPLSLLFNLAQLHEQGGDTASAARVWNQLADSKNRVSQPYQMLVELKSGKSSPILGQTDAKFKEFLQKKSLSATPRQGTKSFSLRLGGANLKRSPGVNGSFEYSSAGISHLRATPIRLDTPQNALKTCCGSPAIQQTSGLGEIWIYNNRWAALVNAGKVTQIWENLSAR